MKIKIGKKEFEISRARTTFLVVWLVTVLSIYFLLSSLGCFEPFLLFDSSAHPASALVLLKDINQSPNTYYLMDDNAFGEISSKPTSCALFLFNALPWFKIYDWVNNFRIPLLMVGFVGSVFLVFYYKEDIKRIHRWFGG